MKLALLMVGLLVAMTGCFGKAEDLPKGTVSEIEHRNIRYQTVHIERYGECTFAFADGYSASMVLVGCK